MDKHLSSQFDADLRDICQQLMHMGGLVEAQLKLALSALHQSALEPIEQVMQQEPKVNQIELAIDAACNEMIVRRQPIASDFRLLMAISKATANLERAGDEAVKVAKRTRHILKTDPEALAHISFTEIKYAGQLAQELLRSALDAFTRLDVQSAMNILKDDQAIDDEFKALTRKLITYMMENPKYISIGLDLLFIGKAVERIGDHAKNIAEFVIYMVKGMDVRHLPLEEKERQALN